MQDYLNSRIIITPKQSMFGRVRTINLREETLNASLTVRQKKENNLSSSLWVNKPFVNSSIRVRQMSTLQSKVMIVKKVEQYLKCSLIVNAHNRLYGIVDLQPAPRYWLCDNPIKDTHVREDLPTYNLGNRNVMYVGCKDGYRYRAFIAFNIDSIPEHMFITQAKLTLHFSSYNEFNDFELSVLNRDWHEEGTTWNYQPTKRELISITNLPDGVIKAEFDVRDIVEKWYNGEIPNYGFLLKSSDETEYEEKLKGIFSKESELPPELCVEYLNPHVFNPRSRTFRASLTVRQRNQSVFKASLEVPVYYGDSNLKSSLEVTNHRMLLANIRVKERIKVPSENILKSSLIVKQTGKQIDFNGKIIINKKTLFAKLYIPFKNDLKSTLNIRTFNNLTSNVYVNIPWLKSSLKVRPNSNINVSLIVKQVPKEDLTFPASLIVSRPFVFSNLNIRPISQIVGRLYVVKKEVVSLNSSVNINKPWLASSLRVRKYNDLLSSIKIRPNSSLNASVNIRTHNSINSNINVRIHNSLKANIDINPTFFRASLFIRGRNHIRGKIIVRPNSSLKSSIRVVWKDDFNSSLVVKQRFFSDMFVRLKIAGVTSNRAYGFIL